MCALLKVQLTMRPLAVFDPNNKEHREDYMVFIKTKSLGRTKYRYIPPAMGSVLDNMKESMLAYYTKSEFNS